MKEYIKKFASATTANNYSIVDILFTTTIVINTAQNIICNQENKKIAIDKYKNISIINTPSVVPNNEI